MPASWRFGEDSPWCFYCGTYHARGLVDLWTKRWLGRLCPACMQAGPRQAAARARPRATELRRAADQLASTPGIQQALREYASLLENLADQVEPLDAWP